MRLTIITGFFLPVPPIRGGATEKIWHRLAQVFAAEGHTVTFISRSRPGWASAETVDGVAHRRLRGTDHSRSLAINLFHDFFWGLRVARALPAGDVVICNTVTLPAWLPWVKPSAGRVAVVLGRVPKGQLRFYRKVARLYATSPAVAALAAAAGPLLQGRIRVMWNPIDWKLHASAAAQTGRPVTIGFVGRLHPEKGLELLLQAAALLAAREGLPPWRLEFTGPSEVSEGGGGTAWLNALSAQFLPALGSRLEFHPPEFDSARLALRYGAIDVFCYPSLAEKGETFGVAVAEAMAAGAVPVVSGLACFDDLVQDGVTGVVFDHRAPDAAAKLAEALARLLTDANRRHTLAQRARESVRRFDTAEIARALLADLGGLAGP